MPINTSTTLYPTDSKYSAIQNQNRTARNRLPVGGCPYQADLQVTQKLVIFWLILKGCKLIESQSHYRICIYQLE